MLPPDETRTTFVPERPAVRRAAMLQSWCEISFLHWRCDAAALQVQIPPGLTVDTLQGVAWVGLTPFHLRGLRPPFVPALPWLSRFPEMNLRTYVIGPAGRGIWFFSLDAARGAAVLGARLAYGLPYHWSTMRVQRSGSHVHYSSARPGAMAAISVEVGAPLPDPGDLARFLTERYRLYALLRGRLASAPVEHRPWTLHGATLLHLKETVRQSACLPHGGAPDLVHYSPGVSVRVGWPRRQARPPGG